MIFLYKKRGCRNISCWTAPSVIANTISRVLYSLAEASIIYLRLRSPAASSNLPPDIGRATLNCRYTRSCNPQGVLPANITAAAVGSYPTFSPLPKCLPSTPKPHDPSTSAPRRLFSVTLLHPYEHRAVNSCGALRCSDFPLPLRAAIERTCKCYNVRFISLIRNCVLTVPR